jgi:hypothetical protein
MHVVLHYIGPAENDLKYQYKIMVMNNEDEEDVVLTRRARRFTEPEDDEFFPKNCSKLLLTERFRNESGEFPVSIEILRVSIKRSCLAPPCAMPPGPKLKKVEVSKSTPQNDPKVLGISPKIPVPSNLPFPLRPYVTSLKKESKN